MNADISALLTAISPENLAVAHDTSRAKYPGGKSPYKPLLLLAVFTSVYHRRPNFYRGWFRPADALEPFVYLHATIYPTEENSLRVVSSHLSQPYWYLGTGKPNVWSFRARRGKELELQDAIDNRIQIKTYRKLEKLVEYAKIDGTLLEFLGDSVYEIISMACVYLVSDALSAGFDFQIAAS